MSSSSPATVGPSGSAAPRREVLASRWRRPVLLTAAVAVMLLALSWALVRPSGDGPISPPGSVTLSGLSMSVGEVATWGSVMVLNDTAEPLTLEGVHLVEGTRSSSEAVTVLAVEAVDVADLHGTGIGMVAQEGYDVVPAADRHTLDGFVVRPGHTAALLVRYQAARKGAWRFDFADVTYVHAGNEFTVRMPQALGVCADMGPDCEVGKPPGL